MQLWEQQQDESHQAFEAFRKYLDLGVDRSTAKVAQALSKSKTLMDRWSSNWNWSERVSAYSAHLNSVADKAREKETAKQARKIISPNEVLEELTEIAECDWHDFVEVKYGREGEVINANLRLSDKLKALELAGKHHKLFTEKVETTTPESTSDMRSNYLQKCLELDMTPDHAKELADRAFAVFEEVQPESDAIS